MLALVTGAGTGIGRACALELANNGFDMLIFCNRSVIKAIETAEACKAAGVSAEVFCVDISDAEALDATVNAIIEKYGAPDVVVNNAGVWCGGQLQDMTDEQFDNIMNVNMRAMFHVCRALTPAMISRKSGSIVNISSIWGQIGASCESLYSASKGAVDAFTKSLAKELGPSGIRVNAVSPGLILTDMCSGYSDEELNAFAEETPLGRNGTPEDVAKAVAFLASDNASFITGQILGVNGGIQI
jgi:3-oxoacyl-[acyl-carrier protein] reductase